MVDAILLDLSVDLTSCVKKSSVQKSSVSSLSLMKVKEIIFVSTVFTLDFNFLPKDLHL